LPGRAVLTHRRFSSVGTVQNLSLGPA